MSEKYVNKVVYGSDVLIDLTSDTVAANKVLSGFTFHNADGSSGTGTCQFDVNSSGVTATQDEVLATKTFAKNGQVLTGTMTNVGAQTSTISTANQSITIQQGYHDGSGSVSLDATELAKIIASNIKNGVQILGVTGTYTGAELISATTASVTPTIRSQTVLPTDFGDYDYISQVNVAAIPYTEVENAAGGLTATIGVAAA
mgnify:CR=1 FL=1